MSNDPTNLGSIDLSRLQRFRARENSERAENINLKDTWAYQVSRHGSNKVSLGATLGRTLIARLHVHGSYVCV